MFRVVFKPSTHEDQETPPAGQNPFEESDEKCSRLLSLKELIDYLLKSVEEKKESDTLTIKVVIDGEE